MIDRIDGTCARWTMWTPRRFSLAALLMAAVASAPTAARADDRVRIEGTFSVLYAYPSAVNYCVDGAGDGNVSIQAQGLGEIPGLGALFLTVKKCLTFSDGTYAGTFALSAANGDTLTGTYDGVQGALDENGFGPFQGVLTITRGTGSFRHARGRLKFEAVAGPDSVGAASPTLSGMAFYRVRGNIVASDNR